jgi:hypothetical protein
MPPSRRALAGCLFTALSFFLASCGGGTNSTSAAPTTSTSSTVTSVSVSCTANSVPVGQTSQCSAKVQGTGSFSSAVSWSVSGIAGGNFTLGTITSSGLYTAPATVPTPYSVNVSATSTEDGTKSASTSLIVAGMISSATQTVPAAAGGTITLPDGSSTTIPAGLLSSDQNVSLTEYSVPQNQPSNQMTAATGPALYLSFSAPLDPASPMKLHTAKRRGSRSYDGTEPVELSFNINLGTNTASLTGVGSALAGFANQAGQVFYQGVPGAIDDATGFGQAVLDQACLSAIQTALNAGSPLTIEVYFVRLSAAPANSPVQGLLTWDPQSELWSQFQECPAARPARTLVVVHGMLSSVEGAYSSMLSLPEFLSGVHYNQIFGVDYDWWNGIESNGQLLGTYFTTIATCAGGNSIDIMAHSEGVPVSMSAVAQSPSMEASLRHFITIAGPILGTPEANVFPGLQGSQRLALATALVDFLPGRMVYPPASIQGITDLTNSQFAIDLETDNSGDDVLSGIRNSWLTDPNLSQLPVIAVGGTAPGPILAACLTNCFGIFQSEPFDGVVGLDSAFAAGLDLSLYRLPAFALFHTSMVGNPDVVAELESQLGNTSPPILTVLTSSPSASCADNRSCVGPPGSIFTFSATGYKANTAVNLYIQDPTGTQDAPRLFQTDSNGQVVWQDFTPCSKAAGAYGTWLYDPTNLLASNSVIETVTNGSCVGGGISVAINPTTAQVPVNSTQQFTATVTGTSNPAVTWSVDGTSGGNSTVGTISGGGLYTAPNLVPTPASVIVTATSQADTNVSASASVTVTSSADAPTVATLSPPTAITSNSATLPGTVNPNGSDTLVWFQYSTNSAMTGATLTQKQDMGTGTTTVSFNASVSSLTPNTTYYYQAMASNSVGTSTGAILSFTTLSSSQAPSVATGTASAITSNSATVSGTVNPNGSDTQVWFQYATNSAMSGATPTQKQDMGAGTTTVSFNASIGSLTPNTTYYYQAMASNSVGTSTGAILSFTTLSSSQAPSVTTGTASAITSNSATVSGTVNPNGSDTEVWFQYATNPSMTGATPTLQQDIGSGTTTVPFSANLFPLSSGTTYYYQAMASNNSGTSMGSVSNFTTLVSGPILTTFTISPNVINSGQSTTLTLALSGPAIGTATISLSSNNPSAFPVPSMVNIQSGQTSTSFDDEAGTVGTPTTVTVTASYNGSALQAQVTVDPLARTVTSVAPNPVLASNSDQPIGIFGSNFQNGDTLTFTDPSGGIYQSDPNKLTFVSSTQIDYEFNDADDIGTWTVTVNSADGTQHSNTYSFAVAMFTIGELVMVSGTGGEGLNLRNCPATSCMALIDMPDGTVMEVVGGPTTADGYTWWNLSGTVGGVNYTGWAIQNFLVPD